MARQYKYNGKELNEELGLNWYDYGARNYQADLGRWFNVDPLAEKYFNVSSYNYCVNNPIVFVDPKGEEIWIYYDDENGNKQKLQYIQGMNYEGNNSFVSTAVKALNQMNSTDIGREVLGELISSENRFDFKNEVPVDKNGNPINDVLAFDKNKGGGGTIKAGALMSGKLQEGQKLETTAHELYHGYQHEYRQKGTINNEVGAYLFGRAVYYNYQMNNDNPNVLMPWGNGTTSGNAYEAAMNALIWAPSFNYSQYSTAVSNFKTGSSVNTTATGGQGLYKNATIKPASTNPLIKKFFPLIR